MNECCANCKYFRQLPRKLRLAGVCEKHYLYRISDKFTIHMDTFLPEEFICEQYEENPKPIYVVNGNDSCLVPPQVVQDLLDKGWVLVKDGILLKKEIKDHDNSS